MPNPAPRPEVTKGPIHKVPCPYCKGPLDFRAHAGEEMGGTGWGEQALEKGAVIECEHCVAAGRPGRSRVASVDKLVVITLAPI